MMRSLPARRAVPALLIGLSFLAGSLSGQAADQPPAGTESTEAVASETAQAPPSSGLPPRMAPPPTMAGQWPVFVVFAVSWIGIIGYLLASGRRVERLAQQFAELEDGS